MSVVGQWDRLIHGYQVTHMGAKRTGSYDYSPISVNTSKTIYSTQEDIVPSDKLVNVYSCSHSDGLANRQIVPRAESRVDGKAPYIYSAVLPGQPGS